MNLFAHRQGQDNVSANCRTAIDGTNSRLLGIPVYSGNFSYNMRAVLVQNMRNLAKYALKYAAYMLHICGITEICGVNDACACVYVGQNARKC